MNDYAEFKKHLEAKALIHSDSCMLGYMKLLLHNLYLTVPGVQERIVEETKWLIEYNSRNTSCTSSLEHLTLEQ